MESLDVVRELARILRSEGLAELDYESGEVRVRLVSHQGTRDAGQPTA